MSWIEKYEENKTGDLSKFVKIGAETEVEIDLVTEPVSKVVRGTDGFEKTYYDVVCTDGKILSCTNYLFRVLRTELEKLRGREVSKATVRIKRSSGDKVTWMVVLVAYS
jgi:hypothetical protein